MTNNLSETNPTIFVSHRTRDREIAQTISNFIRKTTGGNINIFSFSDEKGRGLSVGNITSYELAKILKKCSVVILLYTRPEDDWIYCIWECGVAFDPEHILQQNIDSQTKIIVFQFSSNLPRPLSDGVCVDARSVASVRQFVRQLLTDNKFFPGYGLAATNFSENDELINKYGKELYEELGRFQSSWESEEKFIVWPRIVFELSLDRGNEASRASYSDSNTLLENIFVHEYDREACGIFSLTNAHGRTLGDLYNEWNSRNPGEDTRWLNFLITQIIDSISGRKIEPHWELLSTNRRGSFIPIVLSCSRIPIAQKFFIEVCFPEIVRTLEVPETDSRSRMSVSAPVKRDPVLGQNFKEPSTETNFIWIEGNSFAMGSDEVEPDAHAHPCHTVQISSFWLAETPVTREQYESYLMEANDTIQPPYWLDSRFSQLSQPVVGITWDDAVSYTMWLSEKTGLNIKLPTEAQWEFAARGPQGNIYPWGDNPPNENLACFEQNEIHGQPCPVGSFIEGKGPFGTLDQSGNVWEWCSDEWDESAYTKRDENTLDPKVHGLSTSWRAVRGGGWDLKGQETKYLMSAYRMGTLRNIQHWAHGFRIALIPKKT